MSDSIGSTGNPAARTDLRCHFCGGTSVRRTRFRASDLWWLLLLRWPVRCRRCSKRQFVFFSDARRIIASSGPTTVETRTQDSWQTFTTGESPALRNQNPATSDEGER